MIQAGLSCPCNSEDVKAVDGSAHGQEAEAGEGQEGEKSGGVISGGGFWILSTSYFLSLLLLLLLPSLLLLLANWWTEWSKDTAENIGIYVEGRGSLQMRIPIRV